MKEWIHKCLKGIWAAIVFLFQPEKVSESETGSCRMKMVSGAEAGIQWVQLKMDLKAIASASGRSPPELMF